VTLEARFWAKVDSSAGLLACWPWTGYRTPQGYGRLTVNRSPTPASRVALGIAIGRELTAAEEACHTCDNPPCCNPAHLFVGTHADNVADANAKGRASGGSLRGSSNPSARLTEVEVLAIRSTFDAGGVTKASLAARFGVSDTLIGLIVTGRLWQHTKEAA
jgi:hypothetical protein